MASRLADACLRTYDAALDDVAREAARLAMEAIRLRALSERIAAERAELSAKAAHLDRVYWQPQCHLPGCPCNGTDGAP